MSRKIRKFVESDRKELINKTTEIFSLELSKFCGRKYYIDKGKNVYCFVGAGKWHGIYQSMIDQLMKSEINNVYLVAGIYNREKYKMCVYYGEITKIIHSPEVLGNKNSYDQYDLTIITKGKKAHLKEDPSIEFEKAFEYEPAKSFTPVGDQIELKESSEKIVENVSEGSVESVKREAVQIKEKLIYFCSDELIDEMFFMLKKKKNIILQGPPGVGKSFIANGIAREFVDGSDENMCMIQFHQSYGYEEFIRGFKPLENGSFALKDGVFKRFCDKARNNPKEKFVFIIDEINRGNLSRVFGETMLLIESDKRSPNYAVELAYHKSDEPPFYIPENVYVIGMMNTADRSLAMVDYALRRRFVFFEIAPAFNNKNFMSAMLDLTTDKDLITSIILRMNQINSEICEDETSLGSCYQIGHSYFCEPQHTQAINEDWYRRVIKYEIAPLLREYWFDRSDKADKAIELLLQPL